jgi:hypothetical protein
MYTTKKKKAERDGKNKVCANEREAQKYRYRLLVWFPMRGEGGGVKSDEEEVKGRRMD